jgi:putative membrane protein
MNRSFLLATVVAAALGASPAAWADSPRQFLGAALQGANSEIMLGNLAAERARSPAVREFGQTLVSDHQQARRDVVDMGRRFGIWPNRRVSDEARDERDRLEGLRGREFDREFVRFMIDDHRKDISEFRDEAREGHGPVSDLARNQIPVMRNHLRMAVALERSDGRSSEGGWDMARERGDRDESPDYGRWQRNWER